MTNTNDAGLPRGAKTIVPRKICLLCAKRLRKSLKMLRFDKNYPLIKANYMHRNFTTIFDICSNKIWFKEKVCMSKNIYQFNTLITENCNFFEFASVEGRVATMTDSAKHIASERHATELHVLKLPRRDRVSVPKVTAHGFSCLSSNRI